MTIGLMGAMPEEINKVINSIDNNKKIQFGNCIYNSGKLFGQEVVAVFSRWGKVAAASTATCLISKFNVDRIIFIGIAGAISGNLNIGDIVIGKRFFQHDMDARPLMQQFEIPLTGKTYFESSEKNNIKILEAARNFLENNIEVKENLAKYNILNPKIVTGDIASGDLFVSGDQMKKSINEKLPSVLCVEMEGAAVAQVCDGFDIPLNLIRVISDNATEHASENCQKFVKHHAANYSVSILKEYMKILSESC